MSVKLTISVPDIDAQLASGFDRIRVFRSVTGPTGSFIEVTAAAAQAAALTGTAIGPFNVSGLSFTARVNRGPVQTAVLTGTDPLGANQVASALASQIAGLTGADDGTGRLRLSTTGVGTDEVLELLGDSGTLTLLGFSIGQIDTGEAGRIPMVQGVTTYLFEDISGTSSDWYRIDFINSTTQAVSDASDAVQGTIIRTVAKQQADYRSPRGLTLLRKATHIFRQAFYADDELTTPLLPIDASRYPSFQVVDINGQIVASGLATLDGQAGNYRVEFFVPADAPISNDDRRWRLEWLLIDTNNRQVEKVTEFDVRDVDVTATQLRDIKLLAMCDQPFRVFIREMHRPFSIRLDVTDTSGTIAIASNIVWPGTGAVDEELLTEVVDNETYIYYYDIPEGLLTSLTTYQAMFQIRASIGSIAEHAFQTIEVPPTKILQYLPAMRMCIDKYQKRVGTIQSYRDSDLYEYLVRGLEFVNAWHPLTGWAMTTLPAQLVPFWLMAGQLWGLNAQFLLETDLQFGFSGQTVTLDYDHTGNVETSIQRAVTFIQTGLTPAKTALYRRIAGVGAVAGRPYRYAGIHNFVYPIVRFGSQDLLTLLTHFGLL